MLTVGRAGRWMEGGGGVPAGARAATATAAAPAPTPPRVTGQARPLMTYGHMAGTHGGVRYSVAYRFIVCCPILAWAFIIQSINHQSRERENYTCIQSRSVCVCCVVHSHTHVSVPRGVATGGVLVCVVGVPGQGGMCVLLG